MNNNCKASEIQFVMPSLSNIHPNTQKNTRKPHINKSVETLFLIPSPIMLPNSESAILFFLLRTVEEEFIFDL